MVALHGAGAHRRDLVRRARRSTRSSPRPGAGWRVAAVDGGVASYWHERADGQDAAPDGARGVPAAAWPSSGLAARPAGPPRLVDGRPRRADARRRARPTGRVPVLAVSPALWPAYDQVATGLAFDDEEQYDECMALARAEPGRRDPGRLRHRRPVLPRRPRGARGRRRRAALRAGRARLGVLDARAARPARLARRADLSRPTRSSRAASSARVLADRNSTSASTPATTAQTAAPTKTVCSWAMPAAASRSVNSVHRVLPSQTSRGDGSGFCLGSA